MKLYNLGKVNWQNSQLIYHALAEMGQESLVLVSPSTPYVCIGFHQDARQEVDLEYCHKNGIPVFRREVGGGAVYLDGDQLFFQLILKRKNPAIPTRKDTFYRKLLQPVVNTYRKIGIEAKYKPVNDVIVSNRKISGTGVAEIGESIVFVGNLILDFNYKMMCRILKIPNEKFRDKIYKTMEENLSTIRRELGENAADQWNEATLNKILIDEFQNILGPMQLAEIDETLQIKMSEISDRMFTKSFLLSPGRRFSSDKNVKIRSGVNTIQKMHKSVGGLIRADYSLENDRLHDINISGDFFCYPGEAVIEIENMLEGVARKDVQKSLRSYLEDSGIETPGIEIIDWLQVLT